MRLLLITNVFPSPLHPTKGVFNLQLVRALRRANEIRVICPIAWTDEMMGRSGRRRIPPERFHTADGTRVLFPRYYFPPKVFRRHYGSFMWYSVRGIVRDQLVGFRPDVILGYWAHPDGEVAVRAARLANVPALVMVGGSDVLLMTGNGARRQCVLNVLRAADRVVPVSNSLKEKLVEFGIESGKVRVVERGVDTSLFHPGDRDEARRKLGLKAFSPVLVWVGRMVPVKGLDVLLAACGVLRRQGLDFHLCLIGDGPLRGALARQADAEGIADAVRFIGAVPPDDLPDWYRAANVVVLPSRSEGVPNVLREAIACGIPYVASRVGGIPDLSSARCNRLVPPEDSRALADALAASFNADANKRNPVPGQTGASGDWAASAATLSGVLRELVDRRQPEVVPC
jgi:glycosyltransferase involved in cell wall biosynthesis